MKSTFLSWDSDFFGKRVYRIDLLEDSTIEELKKEIEKLNGDLYYIFSKKNHTACHELGADLVDTKLVYGINLTGSFEKRPEVTSYKDESIDDLMSLALLSGSYSRFKVDPEIAHKFGELYGIWLNRSINKQIADELFVHKNAGTVNGFVTVKQVDPNLATIGLIAVSEQDQGKSIGKYLINTVKHWCCEKKIDRLTVATQKQNTGACEFYKRCGFEVESEDYIYHYHRNVR